MKSKKVLIEIGHPAHVHQFKYIYFELKKQGHQVLIVAKRKEISELLLQIYNIEYVITDETKKGMLRKIINLPYVYYKMFRIIRKFKPDIILSRFSLQSSHLAYLFGIFHIGFADTEHVNISDNLTVPLVNFKLTSTSYDKNLGLNQYRYDGNIELFYLHPNWFNPDSKIREELNLNDNERYAILRFVSWDAHHDIGQSGLSEDVKMDLVKELSKYLKVFITSEDTLPDELEQYQIKIEPERIHHALAFADLYVGEGGTMASEAVCLGTPSIYINQLNMGYLQEQVKYGLLHSYRNLDGVVDKAVEIAKNSNSKLFHREKLIDFLKNKIDSSSFVIWIISNYPKSIEILSNDEKYYENFISQNSNSIKQVEDRDS